MAEREITLEEIKMLDDLFARAQAAAKVIETYDQERVDQLIQAVAWSVINLQTWKPLAYQAVEETRLGDPVGKVGKRRNPGKRHCQVCKARGRHRFPCPHDESCRHPCRPGHLCH